MTTIEWDKPKDRRYEIGIDRGVLYPNGSAGVPWNGLVSVDEDASGADVEPLYIDGYKYFDAVANEDFQATLSAFTYPKEFEACLGNVPLANGMFATMQRRQTFGLSWRTKTGNAADGEDGYKIHILYGATAIPATKSNETLGDTPQPVNFQWTITAVPQLPGMDLNDPNSDPNSWVWPEGYGMPGWPMGPDGNTPVPGWRGFPYVIIDSNDVDPAVLENLETHLYGIDHTTPAYLPTLTDVTNILNGHDVPYDYGFDWTDPNPVESVAGPRFYWSPNDLMIQSYDITNGTLKTLVNTDTRIPAALRGISMGGPVRLGNGKFFVRVGTTGADQQGFIVDADLNPTGETWSNLASSYWYNAGYVDYNSSDGVFDPDTGLNWMTESVADHPWAWNGYDDAGRFVKGKGDTAQCNNGDGYIGGNVDCVLSLSLVNGTIYRNGPNSDLIERYNFDTETWEATLLEWQNPANTADGFGCWLLGVDPNQGLITLNTQSDTRSNYDGKRGWVQIRPFASITSWVDPVPDGISQSSSALGRPSVQYNPAGPGGPALVNSLLNAGSRFCLVQNGKLYYNSTNTNGVDYTVDYSSDPNGQATGMITSIYAMNLADGTIEKVVDIPYHDYDQDGKLTDHASAYSDNYLSGGMQNIIFDDGTLPVSKNFLNLTSPAVTDSSAYATNGWAEPQILYGIDNEYSALVDSDDSSWLRNTYSRLDTTAATGAGTQFSVPVVASGGTSKQLDGMTITFRVKADSDMGLTQVPLNFYLSDTYRYVVSAGQIPVDGAWHDVTVTITEQQLIDATANNDILNGLMLEMSGAGANLVVYTDSSWADNLGAATPWNVWLDFSNIEVHSA